MAKRKAESKPSGRQSRSALTPEGRDNQMISLAVNLAEQQLRDGTASPSVITHYLRLGSTIAERELELEKLRIENELAEAKIEAIKSQTTMEEMYRDAINAMKKYGGSAYGNEEGDSEIF